MRTLITALAVAVFGLLALGSTQSAEATYWNTGHNGQVHCMQYGETLYGVAWRYGTTAHAIAAANGIYNPNYVRAGQCLHIPSGHGYGKVGYDHGKHAKPKYDPGYHKPAAHKYHYGKKAGNRYCLRYGETLSAVAWRNGTTVWALAHANGIYNPNYVRAGQCLRIPGHGSGY